VAAIFGQFPIFVYCRTGPALCLALDSFCRGWFFSTAELASVCSWSGVLFAASVFRVRAIVNLVLRQERVKISLQWVLVFAARSSHGRIFSPDPFFVLLPGAPKSRPFLRSPASIVSSLPSGRFVPQLQCGRRGLELKRVSHRFPFPRWSYRLQFSCPRWLLDFPPGSDFIAVLGVSCQWKIQLVESFVFMFLIRFVLFCCPCALRTPIQISSFVVFPLTAAQISLSTGHPVRRKGLLQALSLSSHHRHWVSHGFACQSAAGFDCVSMLIYLIEGEFVQVEVGLFLSCQIEKLEVF
jgi:hypothetical protein